MELEGLVVAMAILLLCAVLLIVLLLVVTMFNQRWTVEWHLRQRCGDCRVVHLAKRVLSSDSSLDEYMELTNLLLPPDAAANLG